MQHRGEIVKEAVYKSGFPITELAKRLGKSRRSIYLLFESSNVSLDLVLQIGKVIHYDFKAEIKEFSLSKEIDISLKSDNETEEYNAEYWKNKYLKLLEEYNEILKGKI